MTLPHRWLTSVSPALDGSPGPTDADGPRSTLLALTLIVGVALVTDGSASAGSPPSNHARGVVYCTPSAGCYTPQQFEDSTVSSPFSSAASTGPWRNRGLARNWPNRSSLQRSVTCAKTSPPLTESSTCPARSSRW